MHKPLFLAIGLLAGGVTAQAQDPPPMRHAKRVQLLRFSPNGAMLASVSEDQTVKLWDTASRKELGALDFSSAKLLGAYVDALAFLPDGKTLITVSAVPETPNFTLVSWNAETRKRHAIQGQDTWQIPKTEPPFLVPEKHGLYALSPDGQHFVTIKAPKAENIFVKNSNVAPGSVLLYRLESGWKAQELCILREETKPPRPAFSADGKRLATGLDRSMVVWDTKTQQPLATFGPFPETVAPNSLHLSADGSYMYSMRQKELLGKWDVAGQKFLGQKAAMGFLGMSSLQVSPDGKQLAAIVHNAIYNDFVLMLWDSGDFKHKATVDAAKGRRPVAFAFGPDGAKVAVAGDDHVIHLWNAAELPKKN